jgi:hypothetical protein
MTDRYAHRYAAWCADIIRRLVTGQALRPAIRMPIARRDTVAAVENALARRGRRRIFVRRVIPTTAAAAAVLALAFSGRMLSMRGAGKSAGNPGAQLAQLAQLDRRLTVLGDDSGVARASATNLSIGNVADGGPVFRGMTLEPGTRLVAPAENEVRIGTADGTTLTLEKGGDLAIVEQTALRSFALKQGAVRAQVTKLHAGERFVIATPDGEVEVHGTVFRVAMVAADSSCRGGMRTRVSVFEGVVSVRVGGTETAVYPGGEWPEGCRGVHAGAGGAAAPPKRVAHRETVDVVSGPAPGGDLAPAEGVGASTSSSASSLLRVENDLFASAIQAKRQQRMGEAVRLFSQLIQTYPDGPLTEGAMAQRMNLLVTLDRSAATRAASEYLMRFPVGFAHAEARRIAGSL